MLERVAPKRRAESRFNVATGWGCSVMRRSTGLVVVGRGNVVGCSCFLSFLNYVFGIGWTIQVVNKLKRREKIVFNGQQSLPMDSSWAFQLIRFC
jgi:hypothetical protein